MQKKNLTVSACFIALMLTFTIIGVVSAQEDQQGFLGVQYAEAEAGVKVTAVLPDSAASAAGLQADDIITAVDETAVTFENVADVIGSYNAGDTLKITIIRGDETLELDATLTPLQRRNFPNVTVQPPLGAFIGVRLEQSDEGVKIAEVVDDSPAATAGLQAGDIITTVNDVEVTNPRDVRAALKDVNPSDTLTLGITRGDETLSVEVVAAEPTLPQLEFGRGEQPFGNMGFGLTFDENGLTLTQLSEDNPLYAAGLREGDTITAINGEKLEMPGAMMKLSELLQSETVTLTVERDGESMDIEISGEALHNLFVLPMGGRFDFNMPFGNGAQPFSPGNGPFGRDGQPFGFGMNNRVRLGVQFVMLTEQNAQEYDVETTSGAYIVEVQAESPAAQAGLQSGDIVTAVNGEVVDEEHTLADRIYAYEAGDVITLDVMRGTETLQIEVTLGTPAEGAGLFPLDGLNFSFGGNSNGPLFFFGPNGQPELPQPETSPSF